SKSEPEKKELSLEDFEDLSQIETGDNQFFLVALGLAIAALVSWSVWGT
ncbi:MAG: tetratricopeptide repeat protein, partial [Limnothrix sp. RL_2_0]|nr:tetratricopeptide repeat protein [Limnothrix sp. RL_2_0]